MTIEHDPSDQLARARLLEDAARLLDGRAVMLGPQEASPTTPEGDFARMLARDRAEFGHVRMHPLPSTGLSSGAGPVGARELTRHHRFYWLTLPVSLWAPAGQGFGSLEVRLAFNVDEPDGHRPVTFDALPSPAFVKRFEASSEIDLGVGGDFKFAVAVPPTKLLGIDPEVADVAAGVDISITTSNRMIFGPVRCVVRSSLVARSAIGLDYVYWRFAKAAIRDESDPGLRLILQVPRSLGVLELRAELDARRVYRLFDEPFREALRDLPRATRSFFTNGALLRASRTWELSDYL